MIRIQPLDGPWQTLGRDLYPGVEPEDVAPVWGPAGPESLTFTLRWPPHRVHADLLPFTPVELHPPGRGHGDLLWSGYTMQAPPGGGGDATSVSCVGWHYHRDENPRSFYYVHDDLTAFADIRSFPDADLTAFRTPPTVNTGDGRIVMGWPQGSIGIASTGVGVMLDLGPSVRAGRVVVDLEVQNINATFGFYVRCADRVLSSALSGGTVNPEWEDVSVLGGNFETGIYQGTLAAPRRFVSLFIYVLGGGFTAGADHLVKVRRVLVGASSDYLSAAQSQLTADTVIKDTRDRLCRLLSKDNSRIVPVTFKIPALGWIKEDATARAAQDAANDYHGYRLGVDANRRMFFQPQPSQPRLQVDAQTQGVQFRDTSTNDGSEVYNHVSVRGRSGSGTELRLDRWLADVPGVKGDTRPATMQPTNPDAAADTTGWTNVTRITTDFTTAPACLEWTAGAAMPTAAFTGADFQAGVQYRLTFQARISATLNNVSYAGIAYMYGAFGAATDFAEVYVSGFFFPGDPAFSDWKTITVSWVPKETVAAATVSLRGLGVVTDGAASTAVRFDELRLVETRVGLLGRRNRVRSFTLNVAAATALPAMTALADAWLLAHRNTPFKGSLAIVGDPVTDLQAGRPVPADELGRYYGEMIRVLGVPDPDTGDLQSRDGIIASVNGLQPAQLALDSERRSLEALLARMAVTRT